MSPLSCLSSIVFVFLLESWTLRLYIYFSVLRLRIGSRWLVRAPVLSACSTGSMTSILTLDGNWAWSLSKSFIITIINIIIIKFLFYIYEIKEGIRKWIGQGKISTCTLELCGQREKEMNHTEVFRYFGDRNIGRRGNLIIVQMARRVDEVAQQSAEG